VQRDALAGPKSLKIGLGVTEILALCASRNAAGNNIDADPPVHKPVLRYWQLVLKYFRY